MNLIKKYEKDLKEINETIIEVGDQMPEFLEGCAAQLKDVISDLKKQALNDRFFLEEIVYKIMREEHEHYTTLTRDFLAEYVKNLPLTEYERNIYIHEVLGQSEMNYYFKSESDLAYFLKNNREPKRNYMADYSITDCCKI